MYLNLIISTKEPISRPDPEHSNAGGGGGGATGPDPEQSNTGYDVSGVSCKGGEYERGLPLSYRGPGGEPPGKNWQIVVPEKRFLSLL